MVIAEVLSRLGAMTVNAQALTDQFHKAIAHVHC
jgi:hypothetical protein